MNHFMVFYATDIFFTDKLFLIHESLHCHFNQLKYLFPSQEQQRMRGACLKIIGGKSQTDAGGQTNAGQNFQYKIKDILWFNETIHIRNISSNNSLKLYGCLKWPVFHIFDKTIYFSIAIVRNLILIFHPLIFVENVLQSRPNVLFIRDILMVGGK